MNYDAELVKRLREEYPSGARVLLIEMNDMFTDMPPGLAGTVSHVDDAATVHVSWDNGSTLGAVHGVDKIKLISTEG